MSRHIALLNAAFYHARLSEICLATWSGSVDWSTWLKIIGVSSASGAAAGSALFKLLGDYWLAKRKAEYDKEITNLKARHDQELEQFRAKLSLSNTAKTEVSKCLSEVRVAILKLYPIDASATMMMQAAERDAWIDSLQNATERLNTKLQEHAVFLKIPLYDALEHCYYAADSMWWRLESALADEPDRGNAKGYFFDSYRQACQLMRDD
jgi:hypothetical protein